MTFLFQKITFSYVGELLRKGMRGPITGDDLDPIGDQDDCKYNSEIFLQHFDDTHSVKKALFKTFGVDFALVGLGYFLEIGFKVGEGYMLGLILKWFQRNDEPTIGYYYALGLVLVVFFHSFLRHLIFFNAARIGMQVRVTLTAAIYKKCLSLSTSHTSSTGAIVNLIANDVQKFEDCSPWFHFLWVSPIELCIVWYFIYLELGLVAFAPFITLALMFPLQGILARQFGLLRSKTVELRDEWLKSVSDMISGVMTVKLYAWEIPFMDTILAVRSKEIGILKTASLFLALNTTLNLSSSGIHY
jgi:ATP-binding cassette, subfamily C (CFTR/MRP), member 4